MKSPEPVLDTKGWAQAIRPKARLLPANLRYARLGERVCAECQECPGHVRCKEVRQPLHAYSGIRLTSDAFDCALPVSIDTHSHCSYACLYCFSDNLVQHRDSTTKGVGQLRLATVERLFAGEPGRELTVFQKALKYHRRNAAGYPAPIQVGALNDPCDNIERNQGLLLGLLQLAVKYRQPLRLSTKGRLLQLKEYRTVLEKAPELFWVAFSIISPDDKFMALIDDRAPTPSQRLATMRALTAMGVKCSLRLRPVFPGISDATRGHPRAYKELIEKAAAAGACAVSYEVGFLPGLLPKSLLPRWEKFEQLIGVPLRRVYARFGPKAPCMRPPYTWTEHIMHAIKEVAVACRLNVGVSDPVWKQLTDFGCCCGIAPDDPVFGNWQREQATNALHEASLGHNGGRVRFADTIPPWAADVPLVDMVSFGAGPLRVWERNHKTWHDKMHEQWNNLRHERGPLRYFQGALLPTGRDTAGDLVYSYIGLQHRHLDPIHWKV